MQSVMESIWDFAPAPVIVSNETEETIERPLCSSWPSPVPSHRWIVAAVAVVFLCWMWYTDRKESVPEPPVAPTTTV
jgi:hypothetical protein